MVKTKLVVRKVYKVSRIAECECLETGQLYHIFASSIATLLHTTTTDLTGAVLEVTLRPTKYFECVSAKYTKPLHEEK